MLEAYPNPSRSSIVPMLLYRMLHTLYALLFRFLGTPDKQHQGIEIATAVEPIKIQIGE